MLSVRVVQGTWTCGISVLSAIITLLKPKTWTPTLRFIFFSYCNDTSFILLDKNGEEGGMHWRVC